MRPENLKSRIFLDGGNPEETREIIGRLGFLDGQTTNPTLISKNPEARRHLEQGGKFSEKEILAFYRQVVGELSSLIPQGSISIEVYADPSTTAESMLAQGREMFSWIPNAHIKFPSSREGLTAAELAVQNGLRVNLTLCFSQEQAAAVYAATRGAKKGEVFVSPFIGRLDDRGENGMDLIAHILRMYGKGRRPCGSPDGQRQNHGSSALCLEVGIGYYHRTRSHLEAMGGKGPLPSRRGIRLRFEGLKNDALSGDRPQQKMAGI